MPARTPKNRARRRALEILGPSVRRAREARGLTQTELGSAAGYSSGSSAVSINRIEKSRILPSIVVLVRIAEALGVSPHDLLDPNFASRGHE